MYEVPFERVAHLVTVPVVLNGVATSFVVDSGIGLTVVRDSLAGPVATGASFAGRRMSGQEVTIPLGSAPSLHFAGVEHRDVEVGLLDLSAFPDALAGVGGFLSLAFFASTPLTIDYPNSCLLVGERGAGVELACRVERNGPAIDMHLPLVLPDGREIEVEVDMGSDCLILDERFSELGAGEVRRVDGTDETGYRYTRRFTKLRGRIHPTQAPELFQTDPEVMFQSIIHDGLVGDAFLRRHAVTFDVAAGSLILAPPG